VPDFKLAECSGLEGQFAAAGRLATTSGAGVALSLRRGLGIAAVIARKGMGDGLRCRVRKAYGLSLPGPLARSSAGPVAFICTAPDHWLAICEAADRSSFEASSRSELSQFAAISNQSDGRTIIRISGPNARDALAKGVPLDLHPLSFKPGHAAATIVAHIGVSLWQLDDAPTYELAVVRSFAVALWEFLVESSAEFGVSVADPV
jgi:methylglutamate dehydrogenase subunit D